MKKPTKGNSNEKPKKPEKRASTVKAEKAMSNRSVRRLNRSELGEAIGEVAEKRAHSEPYLKVLAMLQEHGVPLLSELKIPLNFAKKQAEAGVSHGLNLLVHDPGAMGVDLTTPWCGENLSVVSVRRLLESLVVPKWARRIKSGVVDTISRPNVQGMLNPDGSPNKDLKQLLGVYRGVHTLPAHIETSRVKAVREIAEDLISFLSETQDELFSVVTNSRGEKRIRLKMWTIEQFEQQMAKAIKSSSPGYPYNGCAWEEEIEGHTCVEHARLACEALVADNAILPGFVFIQQSRATGDGSTGEETDGGGRQRLVMAAPLNEKLLGHILAYPFKLYARKSPFSGQHGIQEVTRNIKRECQRIIGTEDLVASDYFTCDYDVSDWDAAQIHDVMDSDFFAVCDLVFDDECEFTIRVKTNYRIMYKESVLHTAFGQIKTEFLPSGSSITTGSAFINHEVKLRIIDDLVSQDRGYPLFHLYGFQGDDNASIVYKPTPGALARLTEVYEAYHCRIKGEAQMMPLSDPNAMIVFLNEAIRVRDPIDEHLNAVAPRWSLFWAENYRDTMRGPNIDRMLMEEITREVPHPTATELMMASLCSKLDRFAKMPFYSALLKWIMPRGRFPFRSWLGERVCKNSYTLHAIKLIEESEGIEWPEPQQRAIDRREEFWASKEELVSMFTNLALLVPVSPEARRAANTILAKAKNSSAWKKARSAMEKAGADFDNENGEMSPDEGRRLLSLAFEMGYSSLPDEVDEVITLASEKSEDDEDVIMEISDTVKRDKYPSKRTMIRGLLALNADDPYQLRFLYAEAIAGAYGTPAWDALPFSVANELEESFRAMYGQTPGGQPDIDWLGGG